MSNSIMDIAKQAEELLNTSEICKGEASRVKVLRGKLANNNITISVIGQFKRGKSTLVNAILGEEILPVGIVPVTSVVTIIEYGEKYASVHFSNGIIKPIAFEKLSAYINEQENPDNKQCVSSVTLRTKASFLENGLTFVDTPGVGSIHQHNSDAAYAFVKESDAVIFMLSVDSPINQIEIDFLRNAKEYAAKFYFAVNKIDHVDEEELHSYLQYCRGLLCGLMERSDVTLFPVSAKYGTGVENLKIKIDSDCKSSVKEIIEHSVAMKLKDILRSAIQRLDLYWNALQMPIGRLDVRFEKMKEILEETEKKSELMVEKLAAQKDEDQFFERSNRLDAELNEIKQRLSKEVTELFGMEYQYDLMELNIGEENNCRPQENSIDALGMKFLNQTQQICEELNATLHLILMYREKSTVTVVRRIDDLNKLNKDLHKLLSVL